MQFVVGTRNPVKINAVKAVVTKVFPTSEVMGIEVESGVSHTPFGEKELIHGAIQRAQNVLKKYRNAIAVGLEGGIVEKAGQYYLSLWCVILESDTPPSLGCSIYAPLPDRIVKMVQEGIELGTAFDQVAGTENLKEKQGAIWILTKGLIDRKTLCEHAFTFALIPKLGQL